SELDRDEYGREQEQQTCRVGREHEDEPVPLEVVLLPAVRPLEHVVVQHVRPRLDDDPQVAQPDAPAELEILLVEEELLREPAELAKELGADRERGAARGGDLAELGERVRRLAVATGPGEAAE